MKTATVLTRFFSISLLAGLFGVAQAQTMASDPKPPAVPANAAGNEVTPQSDPVQNAAPMPATVQADPNSPAVRNGMDNSAGASGTRGNSASSGTLNKTDQRILGDLAQANLDEVAAAQLAQQKSQNDQVKNFAQQMITDHGQALQDVQALAQSKGVTLPTAADSKQQKMDDKLNKLTGAAFDQAYLQRAGVAGHKQAHAMLARAQSRATDPDLMALITKMQPTVDQHLATVRQLVSSSAGSSGTRGVSAAGNPNAATSGNTDSPLDPNNPATHPRTKPTTGNTTTDQQ